MITPLSDEEMAAWVPFVITATRVVAALDAEMKEAFDVTHLDHALLVLLAGQPDRRARMGEIAVTMGVDPSVITYRVRRLEKRGLVERSGSDTDRRVVYAHLTDGGSRLIHEAWPMHAAGVRRHFLDHVGPDQLAVLAEAFGRIQLALERNRPGSMQSLLASRY
ncbi:MAG TPA: MarR family transcriptional regulator [Candidatus Dormibacteraeota bacterium]|nr:MarR family transcriptional regulator [Candidatus Dormibacteraeota bacterium]